MYSLFDVEEDEELEIYSGKSFDSASGSASYAYASSCMQPGNLTRIPDSYVSLSFLSLRVLNGQIIFTLFFYRWQENQVTVGSSHFDDQESTNMAKAPESSCCTLSRLSTPNNSPDDSPEDSPPSHFGPLDLLSQGAEMLRRTWAGEETPVHQFRHPVPRIPKKDLEVFGWSNQIISYQALI